MNEPNEEVLKELQRQSSLLESIEASQSETNAHLKVVGTLMVLVACTFFLMKIFGW